MKGHVKMINLNINQKQCENIMIFQEQFYEIKKKLNIYNANANQF